MSLKTAGSPRAQSSSQRKPRGAKFPDYVSLTWMLTWVSACQQVLEKQRRSGLSRLPALMCYTGLGFSALPLCPWYLGGEGGLPATVLGCPR